MAVLWRPQAVALLGSRHLDGNGDALAAADAERGDALLCSCPLHLVQQGNEHAGARRSNRMTDGDGAATH